MKNVEVKNLKDNTVMIGAAMQYLRYGWSVIPVGRDKKPLVEWKVYQQKKADEGEIKQWFERWPEANIGIVTGEISGLVVIDIEKGGSKEGLPPTVEAKTGGGGTHLYYKHPGVKVSNASRVHELTDLRGDGGYVVAPPSLHRSGVRYEWLVSPDKVDLTEFPKEILEKARSPKNWRKVLTGVPEGERNETATSAAGKFLHHLPQKDWDGLAWPALRGWNLQNQPPLEEKELRTVFESVMTRELKSRAVGESGPGKSSDKQPSFNPLSVDELLATDFPDAQWIVEGLIPRDSVVALSGFSGVGKTWLLLSLAKSVGSGEPFLGKFQTVGGTVLVINEEDSGQPLKNRCQRLGAGGSRIVLLIRSEFKLDSNGQLDWLLKFVEDEDITLVCFDTFRRITNLDENKSDDMARVLANLRKINKAGAAVLFTHHDRKEIGRGRNNPAQSLRGSSDIFAGIDAHLYLEKPSENKLIISQPKMRVARSLQPFYAVVEEDGMISKYAGEVEEKLEKKEEAKLAIRALLKDKKELSTPQIKEMLEGRYGKTAIENALKEMGMNGELKRRQKSGEGYKHFYSFTDGGNSKESG